MAGRGDCLFRLFAVAPLLIIVVELTGFVLGEHRNTLDHIYVYLAATASPSATSAVKTIVVATFAERRSGTIARIVMWVLLALAAVGLFGALQRALNVVWDVPARKLTIAGVLRQRAASFGIVIAIVAVLLVLVCIDSGLTVADRALTQLSPAFPALLRLADFIVSVAVVALLFTLMFACLPDCRIEWRSVRVGALVCSVLFVAGQFLLGWYLGRAAVTSAYGAFGALVAFLVWANYSAQIVLLGAEFTHVWARRIDRSPSAQRQLPDRSRVERGEAAAAEVAFRRTSR